MTIDRGEFDALVERVAHLERRHDAAMELIAAELLGLRSHIDDKIESVVEQVGVGFDLARTDMDNMRADIGRVVAHVTDSEARLTGKLDANHRVLATILDRSEGGAS